MSSNSPFNPYGYHPQQGPTHTLLQSTRGRTANVFPHNQPPQRTLYPAASPTNGENRVRHNSDEYHYSQDGDEDTSAQSTKEDISIWDKYSGPSLGSLTDYMDLSRGGSFQEQNKYFGALAYRNLPSDSAAAMNDSLNQTSSWPYPQDVSDVSADILRPLNVS
jgi:hypothetical protein